MPDDTQNQTQADPNAAPASGAPAVAGATNASAGAQTASTGTAGNGEGSKDPAATAQTTVVAPLTDEQHETLTKKIEELPAEIAAWVKKVIAEARAKL